MSENEMQLIVDALLHISKDDALLDELTDYCADNDLQFLHYLITGEYANVGQP